MLKPETAENELQRKKAVRAKVNTLNNYITKFKNKIKRIFGYEIKNYDHIKPVVQTSGGLILHRDHDFIAENIDAVIVQDEVNKRLSLDILDVMEREAINRASAREVARVMRENVSKQGS